MPKGYDVNPARDKDGLTAKQKEFADKTLEIGALEASKEVYPDSTPESQRVMAAQNMKHPAIVPYISRLADEKGLTKDACVEAIRDGLKATKLYGKEGIEHEDGRARLRAAELGLKLHGELRDDKTILPVPVTKDQYQELCREFWGTKPQ